MTKKIDKFIYKKKSAWDIFNEDQIKQIFSFADRNISYLFFQGYELILNP